MATLFEIYLGLGFIFFLWMRFAGESGKEMNKLNWLLYMKVAVVLCLLWPWHIAKIISKIDIK